ncbi:hypothetical protein K523DRAFT_257898, partial [Schizophyllum commune Tattone D]
PDPPRFVYPCPPHSRVPQHASRTCSAQALSSSRRAVLYSVYIYIYIELSPPILRAPQRSPTSLPLQDDEKSGAK